LALRSSGCRRPARQRSRSARHRRQNCMYFETGREAHSRLVRTWVSDQQTCEARAYAVARRYATLLVNNGVGSIGQRYLFDRKQIFAQPGDHLLRQIARPAEGCDVCYTNQPKLTRMTWITLLTLQGRCGRELHHGLPGPTTHAQLPEHVVPRRALRAEALGLRRAPELSSGAADGIVAKRPPDAIGCPARDALERAALD